MGNSGNHRVRGSKAVQNKALRLLIAVVAIALTILGGSFGLSQNFQGQPTASATEWAQDVTDGLPQRYGIPKYKGEPLAVLNGGTPWMDVWTSLKPGKPLLSDLDELGRCGPAEILATKKTLPTQPRGSTGRAKPSGWVQASYPGIVDPLYNRSHILMRAISGLEDDRRNLITGTRYFNASGMLEAEQAVLEAVRDGKAVWYRVTPLFVADELVARGVVMEAMSEDGKFSLCAFAYNVQPGIEIDYATGESRLSAES